MALTPPSMIFWTKTLPDGTRARINIYDIFVIADECMSSWTIEVDYPAIKTWDQRLTLDSASE
jgi:hypothetical protein